MSRTEVREAAPLPDGAVAPFAEDLDDGHPGSGLVNDRFVGGEGGGDQGGLMARAAGMTAWEKTIRRRFGKFEAAIQRAGGG